MDTTQIASQTPDLIKGLAPAFVCGFAVQQLLEIIDQILLFLKLEEYEANKKIFLGILSLFIGLVIAFGANLRMLQALGLTTGALWDKAITAVFISAGTAGFNSVMKFLEYAKQNQKDQVEVEKNT